VLLLFLYKAFAGPATPSLFLPGVERKVRLIQLLFFYLLLQSLTTSCRLSKVAQHG
jgi:hypothetical protein